MKILGKVHNGNYDILMCEDGTKIRRTEGDSFIPEKPESLDLKCPNRCPMGCKCCHEDSKRDGKHGDIMNLKFIDTLLPYTELAIGGGNPLEHPDLIPFLKKCKEKKLICNITVNQMHFMSNQDLIKKLVDEKLIWGLGVSLVSITPEFLFLVKQYPNAVIHLINGIHSVDEIKKLYDQDLKILFLGYKEFRRGKAFYDKTVEYEKERTDVFLPEIIEHFKVVSFDNLALDQLHVKSLLTPAQWDQFFLGADGQHTMYVDAVARTFSKSSITPIEERQPLLDDIKPMFDYVRTH